MIGIAQHPAGMAFTIAMAGSLTVHAASAQETIELPGESWRGGGLAIPIRRLQSTKGPAAE